MAIPRPLLRRDLAGFRFEYWFVCIAGGTHRYFRNRMLALRDARDRRIPHVQRAIIRTLVLTSDGHRGWEADDMVYVRTHRTRAAERETRVARRVRAKQAAAPVAA